jgi:hypothetical protein
LVEGQDPVTIETEVTKRQLGSGREVNSPVRSRPKVPEPYCPRLGACGDEPATLSSDLECVDWPPTFPHGGRTVQHDRRGEWLLGPKRVEQDAAIRAPCGKVAAVGGGDSECIVLRGWGVRPSFKLT